MARFIPGDLAQTPFGKGVVREVRKNGWLAIDVGGHLLVLEEQTVTPVDSRALSKGKQRTRAAVDQSSAAVPSARPGRAEREVDLHGLTVEEALARVEQAVNDALIADVAELRLIHGRSGGRIRASLHRWLREIPSVRSFQLDPRNAGVTVVSL